MTSLEKLKPGVFLKGIIPGEAVRVIAATWYDTALELTYKRPDGSVANELLYQQDEDRIEIIEAQQSWTFDADPAKFKLSAEAYRIHLAHLFDPVLAVHTSLIEPLPHQITAVYSEMLHRHPLRFLLADDPGAGKTIMAGLFIKELVVRGDVKRCLICVPGNLAAQWQDELWFKFGLHFEILARDMAEASVTGNPFMESDRLIIRLDQVARNDELLARLNRTEWDLIIVDEAHKMSASYFGGELRETKRYKLGQQLSELTRHFLLMTATPHNGKEEDFQLFLGLIDPDRFEGRFRDGVHEVDVSDLMRRMIKEDLRWFDGRPLFPERRAYTMSYHLSEEEARLYNRVTDYVREEFNRADQLGDGRRRGTVGFALTVLQRRLASSPEAILRSIERRRGRLEKRLAEEEAGRYEAGASEYDYLFDGEDDDYLDEAPADEIEALEEAVLDSATAARTIAELKTEIVILADLETLAMRVRQSGRDAKWNQLQAILDEAIMFDDGGRRRKLVIFTEHRDTLRYLVERLSVYHGTTEHIVTISGGDRRDDRRAAEERFRNDPDTYFLIATDAAGEGINLQRAHLMINYDLPWNPNRLEQRFGRIHRIGQTEVCHLWNLVAGETREGQVYERLLRKLETEGRALNGKVFDVLGTLFQGKPLRGMLLEAIRYGEDPEIRARLEQAVEGTVDRERVRDLLDQHSLATESMDLTSIQRVRVEMERAAARRLQPHYIQRFFTDAFEHFGGRLNEREPGLYEITHVPARIRDHAKEIGTVVPVQRGYERVCFDKDLLRASGGLTPSLIAPGHPLLDVVIDMMRLRHGGLLRSGTVLVDETASTDELRAVFFLEQSIRDARGDVISKEVHFVEVTPSGEVRSGGYAPYIDYRPAEPHERQIAMDALPANWLGDGPEAQAFRYCATELTPRHRSRILEARQERIDKTLRAVHERLTREINYWDIRAAELAAQEKAGKRNARLNSQLARQRADDLQERLHSRKAELERERQISAQPPTVIGGALVIPAGLLNPATRSHETRDLRITERIAMQAVMDAEAAAGRHPADVGENNLGWDIESFDPAAGRTRFIEVKGRRKGAAEVTVTRNEILNIINCEEYGYLALVLIDEDEQPHGPYYIREPFGKNPDDGAGSVNYTIRELLDRSEEGT